MSIVFPATEEGLRKVGLTLFKIKFWEYVKCDKGGDVSLGILLSGFLTLCIRKATPGCHLI